MNRTGQPIWLQNAYVLGCKINTPQSTQLAKALLILLETATASFDPNGVTIPVAV